MPWVWQVTRLEGTIYKGRREMSDKSASDLRPVIGDGPNLKSGVWKAPINQENVKAALDLINDLPEELGGVKHDTGKLRWDLLPYQAVREIVRVFTFGCNKYGDRNWEAGFNYGRVFAALQRHLAAWWSGEDCDEESGIHHLAHAGCNVLFLLFFVLTGRGEDDRPGSNKGKTQE